MVCNTLLLLVFLTCAFIHPPSKLYQAAWQKQHILCWACVNLKKKILLKTHEITEHCRICCDREHLCTFYVNSRVAVSRLWMFESLWLPHTKILLRSFSDRNFTGGYFWERLGRERESMRIRKLKTEVEKLDRPCSSALENLNSSYLHQQQK